LKLLVVAESLSPRNGWGSYAAGLVRALGGHGVRATVLVERRADVDAPPGAEAIPCLSSPLAGLTRPQALLWNAVQVLRHARGADLLHFMVEPYATASLPIGLPPTCITVHGTYAISPFFRGALTRAMYAAALGRARTVVCVSGFTRDALRGRLKLGNVSVIHNGHDLSLDGPVDRDRVVLDGRPLILGVGALKTRKGYHVSLRAVASLRRRFPQLRYYLVGDISDRAYVDRLRQDISELGLEHRAVITGPVSDERLRALYQQADLFLLTPVNTGHSFEGFGIAYLEANAFGKPVIGSRACGAEEAIEHGVNGLLAAQNDPLDVAAQAEVVLADPALAARLGAAGRARAEAQTWVNVARQYLDIYEQALRR
jgi:glycosyltransferase involved in cell wall biosynthesis